MEQLRDFSERLYESGASLVLVASVHGHPDRASALKTQSRYLKQLNMLLIRENQSAKRHKC